MNDKTKNRKLAEALDELGERLDAVDNEIRPDLPDDEYGIGELSAVTLVKLAVAKSGAFLDCLNEAREAGNETLVKKVGIVAANEVTKEIPDLPEEIDEIIGRVLNGGDDEDDPLTEALAHAEIAGPVI